MSGDGARDGANPEAFDQTGDGPEQSELAGLEQEMSPLLAAVGAFAREEEAEIGTYAANTSHVISDGARESAVRNILVLQARERAERTATSDAAVTHTDAPLVVVRDVPRWSRARSRLLAAGGGLAAVAVALALWSHPAVEGASLPAYSIAARGGTKQARGAVAETPDDPGTIAPEQRLEPDSTLVVVARPDTAVAGTVAARAFVVQGDDASEVASNAQVAPTGAIELRFRGADLIGTRHGAARLRVIVGRPEALQPLSARSKPAPSEVTGARWRELTVPLDLGAP